MDKNGQRVACKNWNVYSPQRQNNLIFFWLQWPWQGCCCNLPRVCNAVRRSCVPPPPYRHYRHYRHCPPPPTIRLCSLRSAGLVKRVWPAPDQWLRDQMAACWAGFTSPVAMSCMCFCVAEVFFPVLTLYSPRSIVWELFFSPHFPHVNAVFFFNSTCISLLIILVWLCMYNYMADMLTEYKPNRPLRSVGSSQLEIPRVHTKQESLLLAIMPPAAGTSFQKRSDVLKH